MTKIFFIALFIFSFSSFADGPCKNLRESMHQARKSLHECLQGWRHDVKPDAPDPSDDCSGKLSGFIQSVKELKTCRKTNKKNKEDRKNGHEGQTL